MNDTTNNSSNGPVYFAYHAIKTRNGTSIFSKIGAAWGQKDGLGLNIQLECVPIDGRVILRVPTTKD